jgi:hypothetical protein
MQRGQLRISGLVGIFTLNALVAIHAGAVTQKVLYAFHGPGDGSLPSSNLTFDKAGNLYGTTSAGGSAACINFYDIFGCGTVFELTPNTDGSWTETVLYSFQGGTDGISPGNIILDNFGNIYGTTSGGGVSACYGGCGTVFKLSRVHGLWKESVLYRFQGGSDGASPAGIVLGAPGRLYGTTNYGGDSTCGYVPPGCGVLFELSPSVGGVWNQSVLHAFGTTTNDGQNPNGGLLFDRKGNLFGSTQRGGGPAFGGPIFELTPSTSGWNETILYSFGRPFSDGTFPVGGLIFGRAGRLYGAAYNGGIYGWGTYFEARSMASGWAEATILSFGGTNDSGLNPTGLLSTDSVGNLYGTTAYGGSPGGTGSGTVYKMIPSSTNRWTGTMLYAFSGGADGGIPVAAVAVDSVGNIYGSTMVGGLGNCNPYFGTGCGVVFEIIP